MRLGKVNVADWVARQSIECTCEPTLAREMEKGRGGRWIEGVAINMIDNEKGSKKRDEKRGNKDNCEEKRKRREKRHVAAARVVVESTSASVLSDSGRWARISAGSSQQQMFSAVYYT